MPGAKGRDESEDGNRDGEMDEKLNWRMVEEKENIPKAITLQIAPKVPQ